MSPELKPAQQWKIVMDDFGPGVMTEDGKYHFPLANEYDQLPDDWNDNSRRWRPAETCPDFARRSDYTKVMAQNHAFLHTIRSQMYEIVRDHERLLLKLKDMATTVDRIIKEWPDPCKQPSTEYKQTLNLPKTEFP